MGSGGVAPSGSPEWEPWIKAGVLALWCFAGVLTAHAADVGRVRTADLRAMDRQIRSLPADESTTRLRSTAVQLRTAEKTLAKQAGAMSPRERAMAEVQLDIATEKLKVALDEQGGRSGLAIASAQRAADEAAASARRASPQRRVEVTVEPAATLEVYAVPLGVIQYVGTLSDSKLRNLLDLGRFSNRTTPASGLLETGGTYAVWVAPPDRLDAVIQLLRQRMLTTYRKVDAQSDEVVSLRFVGEADRVRLPTDNGAPTR